MFIAKPRIWSGTLKRERVNILFLNSSPCVWLQFGIQVCCPYIARPTRRRGRKSPGNYKALRTRCGVGLVDRPTQLICIYDLFCCQHTNTKDQGNLVVWAKQNVNAWEVDLNLTNFKLISASAATWSQALESRVNYGKVRVQLDFAASS